MSGPRQAALAVCGLRIAYGLALAAGPERSARSWLGDDVSRAGVKVGLRALGAREVLLHAGAATAAATGTPVRPWLAVSIGGDCADIAATFAAGSGLPEGAPLKTLAVAGASAAISAAVLAALEE